MQAGIINMFRWYLLFTIILFSQLQANEVRPVVFVSIPPQKQIIERLAGEYVDVKIMLSPGQSPETFAPTPRQISSLADASIYFEVGVPFEATWIDSIHTVSPDVQIVECCEGLFTNIPGKRNHNNMHIWTDPILTIELSRLAFNELSRLLPGHVDKLKENFIELENELRVLHESIEYRLTNRQTDYIIISHSALDAFSDRYGLKQLALETNGREIGLNSLTEMIKLSRGENIETIFVLEQYKSPLVINLATELDAELILLDILSENYIENLSVIAGQIARALQVQ